MGVGTRLGHGLLEHLVTPGRRRFEQQLGELEAVQRARLSRWLDAAASSPQGRKAGVRSHWTWEEFARHMPITGYADYAQVVEQQRRSRTPLLIDSPVLRHQPTSGSTSSVKWIPYTALFLEELDEAISAWVGDLYRQHPAQRHGTHYWSLSWIPTDMRGQAAGDLNDDMALLSWGKRALAHLTQSVPQGVALADTSDDSLFATLCHLVADESLAFLSVWSPTFALGAMEQLGHWRMEVSEVLASGRWGARAPRMAGQGAPRSARGAHLLRHWDGRIHAAFFQRLWPRLAVVSSWDTAAAAPWARRLQALLPHAAFQGKGLWATEGVVTFPYQGRFPLAYQGHFHEFEDVGTRRVLASWQLQEGQHVIPILTTGSGLARYRMSDVMRVDGHLGQVPCLTFLGRNDGVDLVGEKTSATHAQQIQDELDLMGCLPVTLLALDEGRHAAPGYALLVECDPATDPASVQPALARQVEHSLNRNFHYRLARELGQLQPAACVALPRMRDLYLDQCRERGMVEGNIKIEPLRHWPGRIPSVLREVLDAA